MAGFALVNVRSQQHFKKFCFDESRLNLHRHRDSHAKRLIVFVHGLSGSGYRTWGKFPRFVFDDRLRDPVDVALFDYFSGIRRRIFTRPSVSEVGRILTERLQQLSKDYDEIFIVAHSMGGLISTDALKHYVTQRQEEPGLLRVLAGAIFISTPLNGSKWAQAKIRLLISEWEQLELDSAYQRDLRDFIAANIDTKQNSDVAVQQYKLPLWVFVGARDLFVERSSATLGINEDQIRTIDVGHRKISKPRRLSSQVVTETRDLIDEMTSLRASVRDAEQIARWRALPRVPSNLVLVEFFAESDTYDSWQPIYESVVQSAGSARVQVRDRFITNSRYLPNLLMSAHRSDDLIARRDMTRQKVAELRRRYDAGEAHARAIAVGSNRPMSMEALTEMAGINHQTNQPYRFTYGFAEDDEQLRLRLSQCIAEIVTRQRNALPEHDLTEAPAGPVQIVIDREDH